METAKKLRGVYSNGYGIVPNAVLREPSLTPEAKAIYAYLSVYSGSKFGETFVMPSESNICAALNIAPKRYYKHRKPLEELGLIKLIQTKDISTNTMRLPRAILAQDIPSAISPHNIDLAAADTQEGILSRGYGLVPRAVLADPELDIAAKAYYAYAASLAAANTGADRFAMMELSRMEQALMSKYKLQNCARQLLEAGYIETRKSTHRGCYTCVLLLHRHNSARNYDADTESISFDPAETAIQQQLTDEYFDPTPAADSIHDTIKQTPVQAAPLPDTIQEAITAIVSKAVMDIFSLISKNDHAAANTDLADMAKIDLSATKNDAPIYQPTINITINSPLFTSINAEGKGCDKNTDKPMVFDTDISSVTDKGSSPFTEEMTNIPDSLKNGYAANIKNNPPAKSKIDYTENAKNDHAASYAPQDGVCGDICGYSIPTPRPKSFSHYYDMAAEQVEADRYECDDGPRAELYRAAVMTMARVYQDEGRGEVYIGGRSMPVSAVEDVFRRLKAGHVEHMIDNLSCEGEEERGIKNKEAYLRTCLYNAHINYAATTALQCSKLI